MSLVVRDIHHLRVIYLLRKSDDDDIDNNVEKQVGDGDPVLKLNSKDVKTTTLFWITGNVAVQVELP